MKLSSVPGADLNQKKPPDIYNKKGEKMKEVHVILFNKDGVNEIITPFPDALHSIRVQKGERVRISVPITEPLAGWKYLICKKGKDGNVGWVHMYKRNKIELMQIAKWRKDEVKKEEQYSYPHGKRTPRSMNLSKLGGKI